MQGDSRQFWPDAMRAFAILLVIVIHVSAPVVVDVTGTPIGSWVYADVFDSAARISVPLFFMISGYFLLGRDISVKESFYRSAKRVLLPLIFWSSVYVVLGAAKDGSLRYFENYDYMSLLTKPAYYHLWFLYEMFFLYLLLPFMRAIVKSGLSFYYIVFWIAYLAKGFFGLEVYLPFNSITTHAGYMIAGYLLGTSGAFSSIGKLGVVYEELTTWKWWRLLLVTMFSLAVVYTAAMTFQISQEAGRYIARYYKYTSLNVVLMSFFAFLSIKGLELNSRFLRRVVSTISINALGLYGVHPLVISLLDYGFFGMEISSVSLGSTPWAILLSVICTLTLSFLIVIAMRSIKPLRRVVG